MTEQSYKKYNIINLTPGLIVIPSYIIMFHLFQPNVSNVFYFQYLHSITNNSNNSYMTYQTWTPFLVRISRLIF